MNQARYDKLASMLWDITRTDWLLQVDTILTEPVCPTAILHQETKGNGIYPDFHGIGDTFDEAIDDVVSKAFAFFDSKEYMREPQKSQ